MRYKLFYENGLRIVSKRLSVAIARKKSPETGHYVQNLYTGIASPASFQTPIAKGVTRCSILAMHSLPKRVASGTNHVATPIIPQELFTPNGGIAERLRSSDDAGQLAISKMPLPHAGTGYRIMRKST